MNTNRGKLIFRYGTMSSGKSLQLLAMAHNFQEHGIPFVLIKSKIDDRDGDNVVHSRALGDRECVTISTEDNLFEIIKAYQEVGDDKLRWVLVDEAQFLTPAQVEQLAAVADMLSVYVMCYGLRTDFKTKLFPGSMRLFELADTIEEIKSSCYCGHKTIFNARMSAKKEVITNGAQVEVGGDDRYTSLCRKCYFEKTKHPLYTIENENV